MSVLLDYTEHMPFIARQERFICEYCGFDVHPLQTGSYRNHCPKCLYGKHVDRDGPGDRLSECHGLMKPVGLDHRSNKGWMIVHHCETCSKEIPNTAACDDDLTMLSSK